MNSYDPKAIEGKWQAKWEEGKMFEAKDSSKKPKFFVLDMFPYPSGDGLHVGHPRGYVGTDVIAHYMRMKGYNVLHPMGWDAFGLPAENYAIKTGILPAISTKKNIARFKEQMKLIGLSYDWSREINTTDPNYYKWTQWIFLLLFERGLAYQETLPINWCPSCKTGLANEEVVAGRCERCGAEVTKKNIKQWVLKITDYAEELLEGLNKLDWPEKIKEMQRNWIGKSVGADIIFQVKSPKLKAQSPNPEIGNFIKVFTTRPDTIFGATFMVLAPEHELVEKITTPGQSARVKEYQENTKNKMDIERQLEDKEKTGVFTGAFAINPANSKEIPIYIADYVLPFYGYGAIMAVPGHDERDFSFAKKYNLPIVKVIEDQGPKFEVQNLEERGIEEVYEGEGILINSDRFDGTESEKAGKKIVKWIEGAEPTVNYKLRDWIFSRQRYWGEPIPLIFCENCKKLAENPKSKIQKPKFSKGELLNPGWIALPKENLPLVLPELEKYEPTGTGESPLASRPEWVKTICPRCGGRAFRETNTMPQWAGSCWYFLAYVMRENPKSKIQNPKLVWDKKKIKYWLPVDFYIGGAEHAVLHLLYSRFWIKVLSDAKIIEFDEPFKKLVTLGLILASNGQKMSKSRGNVINPDDIIEQYGADAFRLYEMFMGPFNQPIAWDTENIIGVRRFLEKIWKFFEKSQIPNSKSQKNSNIQNTNIERMLHQTIKKVTGDIETQKFNTAIASMMELINKIQNSKAQIQINTLETFLKILAPFAPHIAEELWSRLGHEESLFKEKWPEYNPKMIVEEEVKLVIQINGKVRGTIVVSADLPGKEAVKLAIESDVAEKWLENKKIQKTIFVKGKLINFVI